MPDIAIVTFNRVPVPSLSLKYTHLAPIALAAARAYAARHGYAFYDDLPCTDGRPACWGKLIALRQALERHDWAFWVDADAVAQKDAAALAPLIPARGDLICEDPGRFLGWLGLDPALGRQRQPVHSAVFGLRSSAWSRELIAAAWERQEWIAQGEPWNGLGEQEAINAVLRRGPALRDAVHYVDGLQAPPALATPATRFVHFYGDRALRRWPEAVSRVILARYAADIAAGREPSDPLALVHWCAIQLVGAVDIPNRGGPERFGYDPATLDAALGELAMA